MIIVYKTPSIKINRYGCTIVNGNTTTTINSHNRENMIVYLYAFVNHYLWIFTCLLGKHTPVVFKNNLIFTRILVHMLCFKSFVRSIHRTITKIKIKDTPLELCISTITRMNNVRFNIRW